MGQRFQTWLGWRRHLHANPELSWAEEQTTSFIHERLEAMGLALVAGPRMRGGFVNLDFGQPDRLIALRGDIDAIPVTEETGLDFRSLNPGVMHACGHDVHTTMVLAVCDVLQHVLGNRKVRAQTGLNPFGVRAIFQPAEEVADGASEMMHSGALENVQQIMAMHVDPARQVGCFGFRDGVQTACCDEIEVYFEGPGGHGARPHETSDTIFAASQFINAAYASVPRMNDARKSIVLSFCQIEGGKSANVIPTEVRIRGTLRSFEESIRDQVFGQLRHLAETIGQALRVKIRFQPGIRVPSVVNCVETNRLLRSAAESFVSPDSIDRVDRSLGGEDFACYLTKVPGSLIRIGSANGDHGTAWLHSPLFDVDEQVILNACRLFVRAILMWGQQDE